LTVMKKQPEIIAYAVAIILKAALLAAAWAGKSRRRGLESIVKMPIDEKDKEILSVKPEISANMMVAMRLSDSFFIVESVKDFK